jgi:membrane protease YdiL (CAAX protease family)
VTVLKHIFWDEKFSRLRAGWRLVMQFVLLIAFLVVFSLPAIQLDDYVPRDPLDESISILVSVAISLSILLSVWAAGRFLDRRRFADFGFRFSRSWWIDLAFGLALGALLQAGIFLIEIASGWATIIGIMWTSGDGYTFPVSILLILIVFLGVGIYEELWNRGYMMKNLAEGLNFKPLGPRGAILLTAFGTAMIFGLFHATNPGANVISTLALVLAGMLYATAYVLTGELAIPIGYHIAWNFFEGAVFGFPVSGYPLDATFLATQVEGPEVWTGGTFGPEAGLLGMLARVVGILLIVAWVRLRYRRLGLREELVTPDLLKHKRA